MELSEQEKALELIKLSGTEVTKCMQCGKCSASCPSGGEMDILPNVFVWDLMNGKANDLLNSKSPWKCVSCFACEERCPRGVSPARIMEAVRLMEIRKQGCNKLLAEELSKIITDDMPQQLVVAAFRKFNK